MRIQHARVCLAISTDMSGFYIANNVMSAERSQRLLGR